MKGLKIRYQEQIKEKLKKQFGYTNDFSVPKIDKVVVNIGASRALSDTRFLEVMENTLQRITGQKPVFTRAKKSISNFKIREGMKIGIMVTLRGQKMYDFLDKLINFALPRVRDFRGILEKSVDKGGNLSIGFKEHNAFPEIRTDEVEQIHGLEVSVKTTAKNHDEGVALLKEAGFPLVK